MLTRRSTDAPLPSFLFFHCCCRRGGICNRKGRVKWRVKRDGDKRGDRAASRRHRRQAKMADYGAVAGSDSVTVNLSLSNRCEKYFAELNRWLVP